MSASEQTSTLTLRAQVAAPQLDVRRSEAVSDDVWLLVQGEWGDLGTHPQKEITVPLDRFLADRFWLDRLCRRYRVGINADERTVALLQRANDEYDVLAKILSSETASEHIAHRALPERFTRTLR